MTTPHIRVVDLAAGGASVRQQAAELLVEAFPQRYAVIPQRFKNWTLPNLLPTRMVDAEMAKQMKLTKQL